MQTFGGCCKGQIPCSLVHCKFDALLLAAEDLTETKGRSEYDVILANYEVLRFIEHGNRCRPAMDCVPGELLIYRVRRYPEIEKENLFSWIKQLIIQIELYHRCRNNECYRYINPYTVLVTKNDDILLLDMDAKSNGFVLKSMQKRAMREHFVKPAVHIKENTRSALDLYGYAKTMQFILASMKVSPVLTRWEEYRLARIIEKCLSENPKKQYEDLKQIEKELPTIRRMAGNRLHRMGISAITALLLGVGLYTWFGGWENRNGRGDYVQTEKMKHIESDTENIVQENVGAAEGPADGMDMAEEKVYAMEQYLLRNTVKDNQEVIRQGEELHREILRYLAAAYDREQSKERALQVYRDLCIFENQMEYLEEAYTRRIVLERELYPMENLAVETGKEAMERFPASEQLAKDYAEAVAVCTGLNQEEKKVILQPLAESFPIIRELESYIEWESEQRTDVSEENIEQKETESEENARPSETEAVTEKSETETAEGNISPVSTEP